MDWKLCLICQKVTKEVLRCPLNNVSGSANPLTPYETFLERSAKFRELNTLPVPFGHCGEFTVEDLAENKACWHRSCHKKFDKDKLDRGELEVR
jgi:hypothetical protein